VIGREGYRRTESEYNGLAVGQVQNVGASTRLIDWIFPNPYANSTISSDFDYGTGTRQANNLAKKKPRYRRYSRFRNLDVQLDGLSVHRLWLAIWRARLWGIVGGIEKRIKAGESLMTYSITPFDA
jgi:hypothetical protein